MKGLGKVSSTEDIDRHHELNGRLTFGSCARPVFFQTCEGLSATLASMGVSWAHQQLESAISMSARW